VSLRSELAKGVQYAISFGANIRDGTKEMDLATGIFAQATHAEEEGDKDARSLGDDAAYGEEEVRKDEVHGEF
jgi:hypothetical protein